MQGVLPSWQASGPELKTQEPKKPCFTYLFLNQPTSVEV
jgi:hypothetical protein